MLLTTTQTKQIMPNMTSGYRSPIAIYYYELFKEFIERVKGVHPGTSSVQYQFQIEDGIFKILTPNREDVIYQVSIKNIRFFNLHFNPLDRIVTLTIELHHGEETPLQHLKLEKMIFPLYHKDGIDHVLLEHFFVK